MRPFPASVPTTVHPRLVRRGGGASPGESAQERQAPEYLPPEHLPAAHLAPEYLAPRHLAPEYLAPDQLAPRHRPPTHLPPMDFASAPLGPDPFAPEFLPPEYLPSEEFEEFLTDIWSRADDHDTEREFSQELPPLPKPRPLAARPAATPARSLLEARRSLAAAAPPLRPKAGAREPAPMRRQPRSSADSIAAVRPIALPHIDPRRAERAARREPRHEPRRGEPRRPPARGSEPPPVARASEAGRAEPRRSARRAAAPAPAFPAAPAPALVAAFASSPVVDRMYPPLDVPRGPVEPPRAPLQHQDEPLAFGGEVLRRAATAVEPAIGRSIREPRSLVFAISAAAVIAAAVLLLAAYKIVDSQRLRAKETASLEAAPVRKSDDTRLGRVAVSGEESSKIFHRKTAEYRDLWKSKAWFHPLTGEMRLPENPTRKFGAKRHGKRPNECGRGHCGVDMGEFGLDVHAVRDGVIEKIQWYPRNNAGKYIRIEHDDGFTSYYIHLNSIREDLKEGMRVEGGQQIGVTGKTGIKRSRPHLHFALSYKDGRQKYFIDPEPLLRRSLTSADDIAAAEAADADVVAGGPTALNDHVQPRGEDQVDQGRHQHPAEDDSSE